MQRHSSNALPSTASMRPGLSQAGSQHPSHRPVPSQLGSHPAGGSVSRSEAGASIDLSAASNTAAHGEDPMEVAQGGSIGVGGGGGGGGGGGIGGIGGGGAEQKPVPRAKSREAEKWFEDSNRNASTRGNVSFVDDDPPFHIPPAHAPSDLSTQGLPMRPSAIFNQPSLLHMRSLQSSGSEEFRSVIDDLTIENKKLKKENRQLKRIQTTHTHPDKLFEVRMHGLDAREKKQLMQLLRQFNDSLALSRNRDHAKPVRKRSKEGSNKPSSSSTIHSNSNRVDSAYASGSTSGNASGNASGSQSQMAESRTTNPSETTRRSQRTDKDQNVRSYIRDMHRLLPKQPVMMTEIARKKLVVRKLEQLYTGKPNTVKKNSQSAQQQQISTEAANEKRQSEAAAGGGPVAAEGSREAAILPSDSNAFSLQHEGSMGGNGDSAVGTPDQRPTRPLDLDLSLAQNAAENIAYIRHLGFKPRSSERKKADRGEADAEGVWVPLNLVMNLAQLHTLNVTPDFVRQALKEISAKFEFSSDETKVRWKGGTEGTRMVGESGSSAGSKENSPNEGLPEGGAMRLQSPSRSRSSKPSTSEQATGAMKSSRGGTASGTKTISHDVSASTGLASGGNAGGSKRPLFLSSTSRDDSFSYQPIFLHGANSEEENEYFLDEDDSLLSSGMREDTTGSGSGQRSKKPLLLLPPKEEGAVIFYHRARFCTDLSGDHDIVPVNTTQYTRAAGSPLGLASDKKGIEWEVKGLLSANESMRRDATTVELDDSPLHVIQGPPPRVSSFQLTLSEPFKLAATGIYETILSDNFALWPRYLQVVRKRSKPRASAGRRFVRAKLLGAGTVDRVAATEELDVWLKPSELAKREIPPSEFPSPGFYNQWSSSESADGLSDLDDEEDSKLLEENGLEVAEIPPTFGNTAFGSHSGEDDASDDEEDGPDDSKDAEAEMDDEIDLLAYERQQNAEEIARREREWEEQLKDDDDGSDGEGKRSSAATVGDRSFLSDESNNMSPGRATAAVVAGQKREREEPTLLAESSPAKRVESSRTRSGRK